MDGLTDSKTIDYQFYCKLADVNEDLIVTNTTSNFTTDLYRIFPGETKLTQEQLDASDTCFKQEGKHIILSLKGFVQIQILFDFRFVLF